MKRLIFLLITCFAFEGKAQLQSIQGVSTHKKAVCTPGIINKSRSRGLEISYTYLGGGAFREGTQPGVVPEGIDHIRSLNFKLKLPLINRPDFKFLLGFSHQPETVFFDRPSLEKANAVFSNLHAAQLKSSGIGLYAIRPINTEKYTALRLKVNYNGDYDQLINFDRRYRNINASWAMGYKKHDDFEWGFGINFSSDFRRTLAIPFIIYNRNFNDHWGIETVFPGYVDLRYNVDAKTILLGGYKFNGSSYSVDGGSVGTNNGAIYHFDHNEIQFGLSLERQLVPWVWANVKAGFQYNMRTQLASQSAEFSSFEVRPPHTPYFSIGIFVSPPNKFCKK